MPMDHRRIAELLAPFLDDVPEGSPDAGSAGVLSPAQLQHISIYIDLLLRWNARMNLTSVRDPEEIVTRHFGESIFAARRLFPESSVEAEPLGSGATATAAPRVIDVGSGAGFPGLPVKIWAPHLHLTLIESNQKKATFLREVVRGLSLSGVDVFGGRADTFSGAKGDVVTLRAVERFQSIIPLAAGLAGPGGRLAILVGEVQLKSIPELMPGMQWAKPVILPQSSHRVMIIGRKEPE